MDFSAAAPRPVCAHPIMPEPSNLAGNMESLPTMSKIKVVHNTFSWLFGAEEV
jgi:hypothetical protein